MSPVSRSKLPERRQFTSPLLTAIVRTPGGAACRVCGETIPEGEARHRAWGSELAHVACGWFRPDEGAPVERRKPGSFATYWEWRCPECNLDACDPRKPPSGDEDRRCGRCKMPVAGESAVLGRALLIRNVPVRSGTPCEVVSFGATGVLVRLYGRVEVIVPAGALVRVTPSA
jgi:rubredoxin